MPRGGTENLIVDTISKVPAPTGKHTECTDSHICPYSDNSESDVLSVKPEIHLCISDGTLPFLRPALGTSRSSG